MLIAEIGQNWVGNVNLAKVLIMLAKENGADLVKFQLYNEIAVYGGKGHSELSKGHAFEFFNYGQQIGIEVFFSVFDVERVGWCEEMQVKRYKIAYSMRDPMTMIAIGKTGKPVIMSGERFENVYGWKLLYCVPKYPATLSELTLNKVRFPVDYQGFSDHTIGLDAAKIALARGAQIIEKHFSLCHHTGVDAKWSMTPEELKELRRFADVVKQVV